jgi:hypothetical protein
MGACGLGDAGRAQVILNLPWELSAPFFAFFVGIFYKQPKDSGVIHQGFLPSRICPPIVGALIIPHLSSSLLLHSRASRMPILVDKTRPRFVIQDRAMAK